MGLCLRQSWPHTPISRAFIHDWDDDASVRILGVVKRALPKLGKVIVVERIVGPPNEGRDTKFSDLNMLVGPNGCERTQSEFETLFKSAGLRIERVLDASVIEAIAA